MNPHPFLRVCPLLLASFLAGSGPVLAQSQYYWDATNPIKASPGSGGTGNWITTTADWWVSGSSDSDWANGNIANFAGTAGTVSVTGAVTADGLTFVTSGYIIGGSSNLTLAGTPTITLPLPCGGDRAGDGQRFWHARNVPCQYRSYRRPDH